MGDKFIDDTSGKAINENCSSEKPHPKRSAAWKLELTKQVPFQQQYGDACARQNHFVGQYGGKRHNDQFLRI